MQGSNGRTVEPVRATNSAPGLIARRLEMAHYLVSEMTSKSSGKGDYMAGHDL
jgi:hypothetical protein